MRITVHGHRPACLSALAVDNTAAPSSVPARDRPAGTRPHASGETVTDINLGLMKRKIHRQTARQAELLAHLLQSARSLPDSRPKGPEDRNPTPINSPAEVSTDPCMANSATQQTPLASVTQRLRTEVGNGRHAEKGVHEAQGSQSKRSLLTPVDALYRPALTKVSDLGQLSAEFFANAFIAHRLQSLSPGANVLVLSDGHESKSAGSMAMDHSHLNIYSTDYNFPEHGERVEMFGVGYNRVKVDNSRPLCAEVFGSSDTQFGVVLMLKGLCNHEEWKDKHGNHAGPVGCAGVELNAQGISSLLAGIAPLLAEKSRFALHGEINFMDRQAKHQALGLDVQREIVAGVERFNDACGTGMASVWVCDTGLVITGEKTDPLTDEQRVSLRLIVNEYFSKDQGRSCEKYPA